MLCGALAATASAQRSSPVYFAPALGAWSRAPVRAPFLVGVHAGDSEASSSNRVRRGLIGALIGAAAGLLTCTAISNLVKDSGTGFTSCTDRGYTEFGLGGATAGFAVGWLSGS